jgi:hypothetical protein
MQARDGAANPVGVESWSVKAILLAIIVLVAGVVPTVAQSIVDDDGVVDLLVNKHTVDAMLPGDGVVLVSCKGKAAPIVQAGDPVASVACVKWTPTPRVATRSPAADTRTPTPSTTPMATPSPTEAATATEYPTPTDEPTAEPTATEFPFDTPTPAPPETEEWCLNPPPLGDPRGYPDSYVPTRHGLFTPTPTPEPPQDS